MKQKTKSICSLLQSVFVLIVLSAIPQLCISQVSQGPGNPSSVIEEFASCVTCTGTNWMNDMNAASADNSSAQTFLAQYPTCFQNNCFCSRALKVSSYGFSIPGNSMITGVKAEVLRYSSDPVSLKDTIVKLMNNETPVGTNKLSSNYWSTTASYQVYGSQSDLWGTTWTPADINSSGFGLFYKTENINPNISSVSAFVDHVRITVYFQSTTGVMEYQISDNSFSTYFDASAQAISIRTVQLKSNHMDIQVFNATGQLVAGKNMSGDFSKVSIEQINAENFANGIYFVELRTEDKSFSSKIAIVK